MNKLNRTSISPPSQDRRNPQNGQKESNHPHLLNFVRRPIVVGIEPMREFSPIARISVFGKKGSCGRRVDVSIEGVVEHPYRQAD